MDLRDLGRGLSYRRLGVLIAGLPQQKSALARKLAREAPEQAEMSEQEEAAAWRLEHHLLALVIDLLAGANWQRGGGKGTKPKPLQRPGVKDDSTERIGGKSSPLTPEQKMRALRAIGPALPEGDESEDD